MEDCDCERGVEDEPCSGQSAARTSSVCPSTRTLGQILATFPRSSIRNVVRSIPKYSRPWRFFFFQTPYAPVTRPSSSLSSGKLRLYLSLNFTCLFESSRLTPRITAPFEVTRARLSRKLHASFVQPGVSSFG